MPFLYELYRMSLMHATLSAAKSPSPEMIVPSIAKLSNLTQALLPVQLLGLVLVVVSIAKTLKNAKTLKRQNYLLRLELANISDGKNS